MIIFDLDGTLADCEHRRHFVDPSKSKEAQFIYNDLDDLGQCLTLSGNYYFKGTEKKWKPDWKAFYEACDKDLPIHHVIKIFQKCVVTEQVQIWSARCESTREKTLNWLDRNLSVNIDEFTLKMRPINDNTPDDVLKERWLDELSRNSEKIDFVFDDRKKVVRMWRRRGIFVFDVNQSGMEF